jgi:hypothetical protein
MATDRVTICYYTSDDPRGRFLDLMRFVKQELRDIGADALKKQHPRTARLSEDTVEALEKVWRSAGQIINEPAEPRLSAGNRELSEVGEDVTFDLTLRRHFGWLRQNWRSVLPKN